MIPAELLRKYQVRVYDVLVVPEAQPAAGRPPSMGRIDLKTGVWVGDWPLAEQVMDACEPKGYYEVRPIRAFHAEYALIREGPPGGPGTYEWDEDRLVQLCVALSRLVCPNSISLRYAAKVHTHACSGSLRQILPADIRGAPSSAFVGGVEPDKNPGPDDWQQVVNLLQAYDASPPSEPVKRALWYHEYAMRLYEVDVRHVLLVTALEALLHTAGRQNHFRCRSAGLARSLGVARFDDAAAKHAYKMRCALSHAGKLGRAAGDAMVVYAKTEELLRSFLRKCVLDSAFASVFADAARVKEFCAANPARP